ncbi:hypothetical protein ACFFTQ_37240 [Streptomyces roseofulvus]|uniref:hypothetical protein n=1 Tax=Streptomyces roseofulvus TaxID=33902 RepID=UPI0035ECD176
MSTTPLPEGDWIRGITIRQPWTAAILAGHKTIENRPRPLWRPGWVLLHAGGQIERRALRDPLVAHAVRGRELMTGAVLGIARIAALHQDLDDAAPCTPWSIPGAWHLELTGVQELALPVPATGQLGPWRPAPDLLERVLDQLPGFRP